MAAAAVVALAAGVALQAGAARLEGVSPAQAEAIALRSTHGGGWTVAGAHPVNVPRHLMWFTYQASAWEIDLVSPRGQAQVVVDRRDGAVLAASEETA